MDCNYMDGKTASVTVVPTSRPRAAGIRNPTGARIRARTGGVPSAPIEVEDQTQVKKTSKKAATDTILDRIENEIDQQGKCIEDLSRKLRFHLEQKREEHRSGSGEVLEELRSIKSEMKAHRTELSELRQDFSRIMQQKSLSE